MSNELTFLTPQNAQDAFMIAGELSKSGMIPKSLVGKPQDIVVCMAYGAELGLQPLQSLQNIAVINGRPSLWGDAVRALVLNSHDLVELKEWSENGTFFCEIQRQTKNGAKITIQKSFGDEDAKKAGLLGRQGPWSQYPDRMKQMRAFSFAARDAYADRLRGFITREEAQDMPTDGSQGQPQERDVTPQKTSVDSLLEEPENDGQLYVDLLAKFESCDTLESYSQVLGIVKQAEGLNKEQLTDLRSVAGKTKARIMAAQSPVDDVPFE